MTLLSSSRLWLVPAVAASLLLTNCARRQAAAPAPVVVETVRPPEASTPTTAARDLADAITTVLHLPPAQTGQVRHVLTGTVEQANAARQQYPAQSPELAAALKRINTTSQTQLRQVMGPTKYREFQTKQAQVQAEMQRQQP